MEAEMGELSVSQENTFNDIFGRQYKSPMQKFKEWFFFANNKLLTGVGNIFYCYRKKSRNMGEPLTDIFLVS